MTELTKFQSEMMEACRFVGATCTRKYYGVNFKCKRVALTTYKWYIEGVPVRASTVTRATVIPEVSKET